jgi:hypothetical protein
MFLKINKRSCYEGRYQIIRSEHPVPGGLNVLQRARCNADEAAAKACTSIHRILLADVIDLPRGAAYRA